MKTNRRMLRILLFTILVGIFILNCICVLPGCSNSEENKENGGSSTDNGSISGTVIDSNGDPVTGARVDFEYTDDTPPEPSPSPSETKRADATTTTDDEGGFIFSGLTEGREGVVIVTRDNEVFGAKSVKISQSTTVQIQNSGMVRGIVSEGGTTVIAEVDISIGTLTTQTNSNGSYTIGGVAFGEQTIRATKSGYQVYTDIFTVQTGAITYKDIDMAQGSSPTPSASPTSSPSPSPTPSTSPSASPSPSPQPTSSVTPSPSPAVPDDYSFSSKWSDGLNGPGNLGTGDITGANFAQATIYQYSTGGILEDTLNPPETCNGVTVDQNGNLFASSNQSANFYKFAAADWSVMTTHATTSQPIDIAAEYQTNRVYVLSGSVSEFRVEIFDSTGASISKWDLKNEYTNAKSIAISPTGKIYISFLGSKRVVVFDQSGNKLKEIEVNLPYGVYVDANSKLYVNYTYSDSTQERAIGVYDINYVMISRHICQNGTGDNQMMNPYGIVTDSSGNIYVSDTGDNKIVKFVKQ